MNGNGSSSRATGGLEDPMIPAHSQQPTSKRKGPEDANPLNNTMKKARKEGGKSGTSNKRKLNGEEQPGGLVIVRAPSARPWSAQGNDSVHLEAPSQTQTRAPSRPPSTQLQPAIAETSKHPRRTRSAAKGKDREIYASTRADPELEEDVRLMQTETESLRRKSQASAQKSAGVLEPGFQFPPIKPHTKQQPSLPSQRVRDTSLPVPMQETPQIERNKVMREGGHRRKSSLSRGKRISTSFETTGVISQPHTSVSDSSFHKHIDGDLPEPQRASQLLIWCSHRAMTELSDHTSQASSSKRQTKKSGKDPPPLSQEEAQVLKHVEEGVIRMLAEKKIDTNVYGAGNSAEAPVPKKENEQNVKNRAREIVCKAKGKQKASTDDWDVNEADLPPHFRGSGNLGLARKVINTEVGKKSTLSDRLEDLEYTVCCHSYHPTETKPSICVKMDPSPAINTSSSTALSSYLPPSLSRPPPTTDPQDLLRALSRIDAERPPAQVGDAALRAVREVQRATDAGAGSWSGGSRVCPLQRRGSRLGPPDAQRRRGRGGERRA
ncbi:Mis12-Mtw1 protein family-domain-containing protein [Amylocystis lapponica]|nr:Mis12-Mtw1 protein family-domain-containing protein [Amylocystis lapponica]